MSLSWDFPYPSQRMPVFAKNVVATSQPLAAQAGLSVLHEGGNAVDAALAAAITLTVVEPTSNGIGSDAFAIIWDGTSLHGINGSGRSPYAWNEKHFKKYDSFPQVGWDTVTVPGAVNLWVSIWERFGRLPFDVLFGSACEYARKGFIVSPKTAVRWRAAQNILGGFPEFAATFLPGGKSPRPGELFQNPDQANTLEEIAKTKGESFYRGRLAELIAAHSKKTGGLMTFHDLEKHRPEWVETLEINYRDISLHEIPPNGQGIAALIALSILRHWSLSDYPVDSADSIHLQIEAMKIAFAEAHRHIADIRYMKLTAQEMLDDDYLSMRASEIDMKHAAHRQISLPTDHGTVYLSTGDEDGMMVSLIQSNFRGFGSGIVIPGTGISMQNRGCGFSLEEGHPNCVGGGKRPYHTIIPGFVTKNGDALMSFGVMGGHMQPQGHVQMITRIFDYGQNPQATSDAPRWHLDENMKVALEPSIDPSVVTELKKRGHSVRMNEPEFLFGGAQLVYRLPAGYCAASDHRKDGLAAGY